MTTVWPNRSPEPTPVGAGRSAVAVLVQSRRGVSFFRQAQTIAKLIGVSTATRRRGHLPGGLCY